MNHVIDLTLCYVNYCYNKTKYNIVINETNDYIDLCNNHNDNEITPNLLLDEVINGCFEEYIGKDLCNVMNKLYKDFYEEPIYFNELE